jgi:plastocyanin
MCGAFAALVLVTGACGGGGGGGSGDGGTTRTVLVDFSSDEFASFALFNFPETVKVRPGDTLVFKQTWTGEPHTVTGGSAVDDILQDSGSWIEFFESFESLASQGEPLPNPDAPGDATLGDLTKAVQAAKDTETRDAFVESYGELVAMDFGLPPLDASSTTPFSELVELVDAKSEEVFSSLPSAFDEEDNLAQNVSQPCYRDEGGPPEDPAEACAEDDQDQPAFDGRQSYYNSGVIPYEGDGSNTFEVDIAADAAPGSYLFYCAIHGFGQKTEVEIVEAGADIPSQSEINRQVRDETEEMTEALAAIYEDAEDDLQLTLPGEDDPVEGPFAGLPGEEHTAVNEFVPDVITVKAGEPITWKMMGSDHTISFNVPRYFPIMEFLDDGTVRINPKLQPPAGGAVEFEHPDEGEGPFQHDGGTFDGGKEFWSSGLIGAGPYLEYTMRITKPGTYAYACLLHPPMVGRIKVT